MAKLISKFLFTIGAALFVAALLHRPSEKVLPKGHSVATQEKEEDDEGNRPALPDEALKFRILQMQDENKQIPADGLLKGKAHLEVMKQELVRRAMARGGDQTEAMTTAGLQPGDWIWVGPGNIGGRIRSIAIDPGNANNIWLGSVGGGIWRSTNAGTSWAPVNDFLADLAISSIVINPANPNIMYAGTGEFFAAAKSEGQPIAPDGLRGLGVFKSTDAGLTWTQLAKTNPADPTICPTAGYTCPWSYVDRLAISPDGATILAATGTAIWRSADSGTTWTQVGSPATFYDIAFHPTDSQKAIASGANVVYSSADGGQNWSSSTFSPAIPINKGRVEVAYAPSSPNIVYASVDQSGGQIYRSNDGGQSFTLVNSGNNYFVGQSDQGTYDNIIWVNPFDADSIIVGGIDLWRSTNASSANPINLTQISKWQCAPQRNVQCAGTSVHADHHMIVAAPGFNNTTNKRVYFSNDGGIYRTDDVLAVSQNNGWVDLNNDLGITQFYSGAVTGNDALIGGTQDNGTVRDDPDASRDPEWDPLKWTTPVGAEGDGGYVAADVTDSNHVYTEYVYLQIMRSSDGGKSVSPIYTGITDVNNGANFIAPFVLDPSNSNRMLAGGLSLWRSNDVKSSSAPTWAAIKPPLSDGFIPPSNIPISAIAISANNPDLVVVGHNAGEIFLTSNGTATSPTWNRIDTGMPIRFVTRLVFDTTRSPNWIYATFGGFSSDNVYVTKNLGSSWTNISGTGATALPAVPVRSLLVNEYIPNYIYVGTEVGIFASQDAGATWQLPQGGPANVSVDEVFQQTHHILAATHGRGFYTNPNALAGPAAYTWIASNPSGSWLNSSQWTGGTAGHFPGITNNPNSTASGATDDLAAIGAISVSFGGPISILWQASNGTGVNNYTGANGAITLGAIQALSSLNKILQLDSGSSTPGTMTLTGTTVDGIDNTILANDSAQEFRFAGDSSGNISLILGNPTNNVIQVNGTGSLTLSSTINGPGRQIEKTGSGTLLINGTNNYSGGTVLTAGTLGFYSSDTGALGSTTAPLTINGGTFDMSGSNQTIGALNGTGGTIVNNTTNSGEGILTVGNGNANGSYGGVITDRTSGNKQLTLVKVGTGTQILSGSNTQTAGTTVNAGSLLVYNTSGSGTGTNIVFLPANAGSTFGGGTQDGSGGISGALQSNSGTPSNHVAPGSSVGSTGILHVGSLNYQGIFDIDIAGNTAGTGYDQIVTPGSGSFFGSLFVRFLNGFETTVHSTDVFDILKIGSGSLNSQFVNNLNSSGRLNVLGTQGSFAVQVVDSGKTLRLTDFQVGSVTFQSWAAAHNLTGANASATADPDGDGFSNLAEYAFGRDPNAADGGALSQTQIVNVGGSNYLGLTYTRPSGANADTDITYTPQRTTDLAVQWSPADVVVQSITPGPGTLETVTVRSTHPMNTVTKEFLRINVTKP